MKFIDFIKPNSKKIFITAILPAIFIIIIFFILSIGLLPDNIQNTVYYIIFYVPLFFEIGYFRWMPPYIAFPIASLAAIVPWYIVSCLIIYSWNKIFKSYFPYNKLYNYLSKWEEKYNLYLFGRIAIVGLFSSLIYVNILGKIGSNSAFFRIPIVLFAINSGILIGLVIYVLIQKITHVSFQNKRVINVFCIFLAGVIILPAITEYYITVTQAEISNDWICDRGQELCNNFDSMNLWVDSGATGYGAFIKNSYNIGHFKWEFDRLSNEITLNEVYVVQGIAHPTDRCKLKLRLEITGDKGHYKMKTYYVNSSGKFDLATITSIQNETGLHYIVDRYPSFDNEQFNGVTWTGSH